MCGHGAHVWSHEEAGDRVREKQRKKGERMRQCVFALTIYRCCVSLNTVDVEAL